MTRATFALEVNWSDDGVTWVDETARLLDWNSKYGRDDDLSTPQTGILNLALRNDDGRFTPEYPSGPLFGNVENRRQIRLKSTLSPTTYSVFTGYIASIQPRPPSRRCTVLCADKFARFQRFHLNQALSENQLASQRVNDILDTVGVAAGERSIATAQTTFPVSYWRNTDALSALLECAENELGGLLFIAPDGKVTLQDRHYRPKQALAVTLSGSTQVQVDYERRDDQVYRRAELQAAAYVDGPAASQIWSYLPLPVLIAAGDTLEMDPNYAAPAKSVITPVGTTDYAATANQDGTGANKTGQLSVAQFTDYGGGATYNLKNNDTVGIWLQRDQIRGTPKLQPSELRVVTRTASGGVGPYDDTYKRSFRLITDRALLGDYATYIVNKFKTPQPRLRVTLESINDTILAQQLARQVSDRVHITDIADPWATQVDADYFIESVEHSWRHDEAKLVTTWVMTSFLADQFWILGQVGASELGVATVLGY